ncbi:Digalactosyldiacylglycerol synthase 2-chloroplastic [Striga hermonthica]|uniref:Digalactosyldiacylglycerol synthase 2-chloroplastic n=1 Tax=Striga hermonthica TaxID=68872 RepID=A0A9N7P108_STRHE|nr:Digalactosyldiacylglycerol synthase 2-chloroplastic [Striga hermonthica]
MREGLIKEARTEMISLDEVIRLSAATQELPRSVICNVHGVNPRFLDIGLKKREQQQNGDRAFTEGAYYIGKMVWSKGYKELLKLLRDNQKELTGLEVDLYGTGEDSDQVEAAAKKLEIMVNVHPGRDHADPLFHEYKVFLNPSTTDVAATERFLKHAQLSKNGGAEVRKMTKTPSKIFMSTSLSLKRNLEDVSALVHFVGTAFLTKLPDDEQREEVGLPAEPLKGQSHPSRKWAF